MLVVLSFRNGEREEMKKIIFKAGTLNRRSLQEPISFSTTSSVEVFWSPEIWLAIFWQILANPIFYVHHQQNRGNNAKKFGCENKNWFLCEWVWSENWRERSGQFHINILCAAFTCTYPKSAKKTVKSCNFWRFWDLCM